MAGLAEEVGPQVEEPMMERPAAASTSTSEVLAKPGALVPIGQGLPALPKKVIEKILAHDYIDFAELPPAKGKIRSIAPNVEGQVILVQAEDLLQTKKLIPDFQTWVQCFAIYVAVIASWQPERVPDLMAYTNNIAKASKKFKWPAWVVYDQNFQLEAVANPSHPWAKIDPSIYSQWQVAQRDGASGARASTIPRTCVQGDHLHPGSAHGRQHSVQQEESRYLSQSASNTSLPQIQVCLKYNRSDGECSFGPRCRFLHCCSKCRGNHPLKKCTAPTTEKEKTS